MRAWLAINTLRKRCCFGPSVWLKLATGRKDTQWLRDSRCHEMRVLIFNKLHHSWRGLVKRTQKLCHRVRSILKFLRGLIRRGEVLEILFLKSGAFTGVKCCMCT
jgi:hypothetical protein